MAFHITITEDAERQLRWLPVREQRILEAAILSRLVRSPLVFFLAATLLAMWLSLGPEPRSKDVYLSGFGLYNVLYDYVPGFRGVRVPARYAMIAALFLASLDIGPVGPLVLIAPVPVLTYALSAPHWRGSSKAWASRSNGRTARCR